MQTSSLCVLYCTHTTLTAWYLTADACDCRQRARAAARSLGRSEIGWLPSCSRGKQLSRPTPSRMLWSLRGHEIRTVIASSPEMLSVRISTCSLGVICLQAGESCCYLRRSATVLIEAIYEISEADNEPSTACRHFASISQYVH